jgi:hypothetical protein
MPAPRPSISGSRSAGLNRRPYALHELTAARAIEFEQDCPGGRMYFRRSALDAYRRGARH